MVKLSELIERVEKLTGPDREVDLVIAQTVLPDVIVLRHDRDTGTNNPYTYWEYTASLDAAIALTERLLPGCDICWQDIHADFLQEGEARHLADVMNDLQWVEDEGFPEPIYQTKGSGKSNSRPLALVLATLRALAAREGAL